MPRVSKVEACLFCGDIPCSCNAKAKPAPKVRAPKPAPVDPVVAIHEEIAEAVKAFEAPRRPSPFASMGFKSATETLAERKSEAPAPPPTDEQQYFSALAVLRDARILIPSDQREIERMIPTTRDPEVDRQLSAWKARNGKR